MACVSQVPRFLRITDTYCALSESSLVPAHSKIFLDVNPFDVTEPVNAQAQTNIFKNLKTISLFL